MTDIADVGLEKRRDHRYRGGDVVTGLEALAVVLNTQRQAPAA